MFAKQNGLDDVFMLDFRGNIAESTNSNIFLVIGNELVTPTLKNGGVNGAMRRVVIQEAKRLGWTCKLSDVKLKDVLNADECFLTNATSGVRWVSGFDKKRFFKRASSKLIAEINRQYELYRLVECIEMRPSLLERIVFFIKWKDCI